MQEIRKLDSINILIFLACAVLVCFGLQQAQIIFIPLFSAYIIFILLNPISEFLNSKLPVSKKTYNAIIFLLLLFLIFLSFTFFWSSVSKLISEFDVYFQQFNRFFENSLHKAQLRLPDFKLNEIIQKEMSSPIGNTIKAASSAVKGFGEISLLTFVCTLFFLFDPMSASKLQKNNSFKDLQVRLRRYLVIKTSTSLITGFIVAIYLLIMGYKFVFFLGFATFILNFIPSFGSFLATMLLIPVFGIEADNFYDVILPLIFPGVVQFFIGNIIEPKLMGNALKLGPIMIIFSLILWNIVFGVYGLFLGVPLSLVVQYLINSSDLKERLLTPK